MKYLSPERSEYIKIVFLSVFRKAKLFYSGLSFLSHVLLLLFQLPQVRFFYLSLFTLLTPWFLEQIITALSKNKKKATSVNFPILQNKLHFSDPAFFAHLISSLMFFILMPYLVVTLSSLITWCFFAACILTTILLLLLTIRNISRLAFFRP